MRLLPRYLLLTSCLLSYAAAASSAGELPPIEVLGHRGARASRPENTLPAFTFALAKGVDTLELDVQLSLDGQLVVIHDETLPPKLCRYMDGSEIPNQSKVRNLTLAELKAMDCGSQKHTDFASQTIVPKTPIPTLEDVFKLVQSSGLRTARSVKFQIEPKATPRFETDDRNRELLVAAVLKITRNYGLIERVTIQSFDHRMLKAAKLIEPNIKTAALLGEGLPDWTAVVKAVQADTISPHKNWVTRDAVAAAHKANIRVIPYTANNIEDWDYLITCGVDGIITDDPQGLINHLKAK